MRATRRWIPGLAAALLACPTLAQTEPKVAAAIDTWLDRRWSATAGDTDRLIELIDKANLDIRAVERILRRGRASYPPPASRRGAFSHRLYPLRCDHVDYATHYLLYVPKNYDPDRASGLLIVAHGGNGSMLLLRAGQAAYGGTRPWIRAAERHNWIVAAPITQRGWGQIGNSVVLSLLAKLQRAYHLDPDRVYLTGHSMGGHMTWRSALSMPDRWAAVSPMSGGYDFVAKRAIHNLFGVPGYATWCQVEPYGIGKDNATNAAWLKAHGYPWQSVEAPGRHTIPMRELPKIAAFFARTARRLYRDEVFVQRAGRLAHNTAPDAAASRKRGWPRTEGWRGAHTWTADRGIDYSTCHWIRLLPPDQVAGGAQTVHAFNRGRGKIELHTRHVRKLRIYLHRSMIGDQSTEVSVVANGKQVVRTPFKPDLRTMLELVREFDDRGRIFHMALDVDISTDAAKVDPPGIGQPAK